MINSHNEILITHNQKKKKYSLGVYDFLFNQQKTVMVHVLHLSVNTLPTNNPTEHPESTHVEETSSRAKSNLRRKR